MNDRDTWIGRGLAVALLLSASLNNSAEFDRAVAGMKSLGDATRSAKQP